MEGLVHYKQCAVSSDKKFERNEIVVLLEKLDVREPIFSGYQHRNRAQQLNTYGEVALSPAFERP